MGDLLSKEKEDDGLDGLDLDMVKKWGGLVRHMEPPPAYKSSSADTRDDGSGQDAYESCRQFMRSAAAQSAVTGPKGFSNMNRIEGGREAVIAALKEYHPGFFEAMPKRKDGLPDQRYGGINAVYAVMGQYMPVLNKDGSLHRGCRVYKIILQEAGIDYNTLTERESHDLYKYWNGRDPNTDMIRNPRLASALRMAHSVKHIGSLAAGHANCLLYLAGLKNEEKEEGRGRQGNSSGSGSGSIRCASDASTPRRSPPPRLRQSEAPPPFYSSDNTRDYSSDDTRDDGCSQEYEQYARQEYERQEYERQECERQREEYEQYARQRDYERQEYERQCEHENERQEYERQREEECEQRYYGTVDSIKKNHAHGNEYAFVEPGNIFLHPSDMRSGEMWVDEGDQISFSVGYFKDDPRPKCVDVVRL